MSALYYSLIFPESKEKTHNKMEEGKEMFHAKQDVNYMLTCLIILTNYNHYLKHPVCKDHNICSVF